MKRVLIASTLAMLLVAGNVEAQGPSQSPVPAVSPGPEASPLAPIGGATLDLASGYVLSCNDAGACTYLVTLISDALPGGVLGVRLVEGADRGLTPAVPLPLVLAPGAYAVQASEWTTTADVTGIIAQWGRRVGDCSQSFVITDETSISLEIAFLRKSCTVVVGLGGG